MSFPVTVIQTLSATVIFVAGYFVLFAAVIFTLVVASCIYKCGRLMKTYTGRTEDRDRVVDHSFPRKAGIRE